MTNKLDPAGAPPYRPEVGTEIFVSLHGAEPFLVTVTGYHMDSQLPSEQFEYTSNLRRPSSSSLKFATFYPNVPTNSAFLYIVDAEDGTCDTKYTFEVGYFFDPQSAFGHIDGIVRGDVKPRCAEVSKYLDYSVRVTKL
jgi:hypothetical protein